jgi:hypothetical protein
MSRLCLLAAAAFCLSSILYTLLHLLQLVTGSFRQLQLVTLLIFNSDNRYCTSSLF